MVLFIISTWFGFYTFLGFYLADDLAFVLLFPRIMVLFIISEWFWFIVSLAFI